MKYTKKNSTLIIAEAGVNHNGDMEIAKQLIDAAKNAGVDYVKFQTFKAEKLVSKTAKKADYQIENMGGQDNGQFAMIKKLELDVDAHHLLIDYCKEKEIKFLSTAFDEESVDLLLELGIKIFKIPSGEITNLPFLEKIGSLKQEVILSTGMSNLAEIEAALGVLEKSGTVREKITILHCNTDYPTPMKDVNLLAMNTIQNSFKVKVGYSDHTLGIEIPIAAVALGASCIEKHFTLDRNMEGPDHRASLEPHELKNMVTSIRNIEIALGNGIKKPSPSETKNISIARKSIHIARNLVSGYTLKAEDLVMKRPGNGFSPFLVNQVIGRTIKTNLNADHQLTFADLK